MEISQNFEISQKTADFISDHAQDDPAALRLKFSGRLDYLSEEELDFALVQIEARRKTRKKIPSFLSNPGFMFPTAVSAEQASNEAVARFHASLSDKDARILDMTAGLGIDAMTFAIAGTHVTACELEPIKCDALRHNAGILGLDERHLKATCGDSVRILEESERHYDLIFIDPARRGHSGQRVHALADCQPDVIACMPALLEKGDRILVKASPLLDLALIRNTVENLRHIYVVCFRGECKEVLMEIHGNDSNSKTFTGITAVDLDWSREISRFDVDATDEATPLPASATNSERRRAASYAYLYEPNAGVMKTMAWDALSRSFPDMAKAGPNTHIFLSDTLYEAFPGRVMRIAGEMDKKALKRMKGMKVNVVSRNHPLSAPQLSAKYGITAGGEDFLYALRWQDSPTFLLCKPI